MNQAFIYLELTEKGALVPYEKPVLSWVKTNWPEVEMLDIDSLSDHILYDYAGKLMEDADNCVVYFRSSSDSPIHHASGLVEQLIRYHQKALVLLQGRHPFIEKLCTSRPELHFMQADSDEKLKDRMRQFLQGDEA